MRVKILDKFWNIKFVSWLGKGDDGPTEGTCDNPNIKNKSIRVLSSLKGEAKMDALIHEMLHAAGWTILSEEWVEQMAEDLARALTKLGYHE